MRFRFFIPKDLQRSSSIKDSFSGIYTNYVRKIDMLSNYNIIILIGVITLLLVLYSFIAYSFLESSSILLFKSNYRTEIVATENNTTFRYDIDTHVYISKVYSITHSSKNNVVGTVYTSSQKYLRLIRQDYTLAGNIMLSSISKSIIEMEPHKSLKNNNKTILS